MRIDVWSDLVCPWCYIGKRRLEAALGELPSTDGVEVVYRSFELDPSLPAHGDLPVDASLAAKYGVPLAEARAMMARVSAVAARDGLEYHLEHTRATNTFDAHRLLHLARAQGKQRELVERLFAAHFTEGRRLGDHPTLLEAAERVGLSGAAALLADPTAFADAVRDDEHRARQLGVQGVPCFVIDGRFAVSGAQPKEALLQLIAKSKALS